VSKSTTPKGTGRRSKTRAAGKAPSPSPASLVSNAYVVKQLMSIFDQLGKLLQQLDPEGEAAEQALSEGSQQPDEVAQPAPSVDEVRTSRPKRRKRSPRGKGFLGGPFGW
jgi:hypothetical protein